MGDVVRVARVPATMLVTAHGEAMSVPRRCIGRPARVVCMPGSNVTASAVADRLCHHCAMIKITGRSYRLKDVSIGGEDGKEEGA